MRWVGGTISGLPMGSEHHMIEPTSKPLVSRAITLLVSGLDAAAPSRCLQNYSINVQKESS